MYRSILLVVVLVPLVVIMPILCTEVLQHCRGYRAEFFEHGEGLGGCLHLVVVARAGQIGEPKGVPCHYAGLLPLMPLLGGYVDNAVGCARPVDRGGRGIG